MNSLQDKMGGNGLPNTQPKILTSVKKTYLEDVASLGIESMLCVSYCRFSRMKVSTVRDCFTHFKRPVQIPENKCT